MSLDNKLEISDDDVIRSVKSGNIKNFEVIVNRYKVKIVNFVFRMINDYDEAQSISQDVFLQIFRGIKKYKENGTFQSFIYKVAKNTTLNYLKKQKRFSFFSELSEKGGGEYISSESELPSERFQKEEREKTVMNGLNDLVINQRVALILKVYLGFSYKKIAEVTGWSQSKIETLISRGKSNLKKYVLLQEKGE